MELSELHRLLRASWMRETSADPDGWSAEVPSWGQADITAVVVFDYLGGEIIRGDIAVEGIHFWNRVNSVEFDLTYDQFTSRPIIVRTSVVPRIAMIKGLHTYARYAMLRRQIENEILKRKPGI